MIPLIHQSQCSTATSSRLTATLVLRCQCFRPKAINQLH